MGKVVIKTCGPEFKSPQCVQKVDKISHICSLGVPMTPRERQKHENPLKDAGSCPGTCSG